MKCREAQPALLEAPRAVLEGEGADDLARHVRTCRRCAALARAIIAEEDGLRDALGRMAATHDVEKTLVAVHGRLAAGEGAGAAAGSFRLIPLRRWRRVAPVLAAAAALTALALRGGGLVDEGQGNGSAVDASRLIAATELRQTVPPAEDLAVESEQRFALMKTDKPAISVVWFY